MFLPINKRIFGIILCICVVLGLTISASGALLSRNKQNMRQIEFNVSGLMAAALTSLNDDYSVNLTAIPAYVDYLVGKGIKSVLVGGSSGEHMFLSVHDRKQIIEKWVNSARGKDLHVQVQVGGAPFADVIELANFSAAIGADSILTLPDPFQKPNSPDELATYVEWIAKAVPNKPVLYYHNPKKTLVNVNMPKFISLLLSIRNFMGIKFTSNDLVEASQVLEILEPPQKIILGGEHLLAPGAVMGFDSFASPMVNLFPELMQKTLDAANSWCVKEPLQARVLQRNLSSISYDIALEGGRIPAMKVALEYYSGIKMGPPALPADPVSAVMKINIKNKVEKYKKNGFFNV